MRVGFAGTPAFAATALQALLDAGYDVPLVLTQPDRPKGRGLTLEPSPVKVLAAARGLCVRQPPTLKTDEARVSVLRVPLDVLVVAS
jgi:methionyl-tRNA formyltransferase